MKEKIKTLALFALLILGITFGAYGIGLEIEGYQHLLDNRVECIEVESQEDFNTFINKRIEDGI